LASNTARIKDDFKKLIAFKQKLQYNYLIEVIIGDETLLKNTRRRIEQLNNSDGEEIILIEFNTDSRRANDYRIRYRTLSELSEGQT
jgi:tyrosine-protein phosphatase YwqE